MSENILKVSIQGAEGFTNQIDRIRQGMVEQTFIDPKTGPKTIQLTDCWWDADLTFVNNAPYGQFVKDKNEGKVKGKLIFNVLDIPEWQLPNGYNPYENQADLLQADAVTVISQYVQSQLHRYFGMQSTVIYNPIKDVNSDLREAGIKPFPQFRVMMVGRLNDVSKRSRLAVEALIMAGFQESEVAVVGSENIGYGSHMGVVTDKILNDLYNSVDYVMVTSLGEGLCLPAIESVVAGALPILCSDMTTFSEFFPKRWGCYPNSHSIAYRLACLNNTPQLLALEKDVCLGVGKSMKTTFDKRTIAQNILNIYGKLIQ